MSSDQSFWSQFSAIENSKTIDYRRLNKKFKVPHNLGGGSIGSEKTFNYTMNSQQNWEEDFADNTAFNSISNNINNEEIPDENSCGKILQDSNKFTVNENFNPQSSKNQNRNSLISKNKNTK